MITATHIIGVTALESARLRSPGDDPERTRNTAAAVAARYRTITAAGELVARNQQPDYTRDLATTPGRSFAFDDLAGDGDYVFLETHSRYMDSDARGVYGWQFDAEELADLGAYACAGDLGPALGDAIWQACVEIAADLPRLPRVIDPELAEFAQRMREYDPRLLAYVAEQSTDPTQSLHDAVLGNSYHSEIAPDAIVTARNLAVQRCHAIRDARRVQGQSARALISSGAYCELLVPGRLPLSLAVARVEAGQIFNVR